MDDSGKEKRIHVETVPCAVCMNEVPRDEAQSPEGSDYVAFLCGLDCYDKWSKEADLKYQADRDRSIQDPSKRPAKPIST
jgi:hypothetical protein